MNDEPEILEAESATDASVNDANAAPEEGAAKDGAEEGGAGPDGAGPDAVGKPTLVLRRQGADTEHAFEVFDGAVIGRFDPSSGPVDVDLSALGQESNTVSRKHAKVVVEDGVWMLRDLGSMNGLWLLRDDFERVESAELHEGAEVALGNARFVFRLV